MKTTAVTPELMQRFLEATPEEVADIKRVFAGERLGPPAGVWQGERGARFEFRKGGTVSGGWFSRGGRHLRWRTRLGARFWITCCTIRTNQWGRLILEVAVQPEKGEVRQRGSIQAELDADSVRAYLRELERLRGERVQAQNAGDMADTERMDGEIEALEQALKGWGNHGGRRRARPGQCEKGNRGCAKAPGKGRAGGEGVCRAHQAAGGHGDTSAFTASPGRIWG